MQYDDLRFLSEIDDNHGLVHFRLNISGSTFYDPCLHCYNELIRIYCKLTALANTGLYPKYVVCGVSFVEMFYVSERVRILFLISSFE